MRILLLFILLAAGTLGAAEQPSAAALEKASMEGHIPSRIEALHELISLQQVHDPEKAFRSINRLLELSRQHHHNKGFMYAYYQLGVYYNMQGRYDSLKFYAERCLDPAIVKELPQSRAFGFHMNATYFWQTGQFDKASEFHFKALRIRQQLKDSTGIAASLASLAGVFTSTNKLDKAGDYISRALAISRRLRDERLILRCLHAQANIYGMSGKYDLALRNDREALEILERTGNMRGYSEIYSNMALCYFYKGDLDQAITYNQKVLKIDRYFGDKKQIGDTYLNMAQVYRKKGDIRQASSLLTRAIRLFNETKYQYGLKDAYLALSDIQEQKKDFRQAFQNYKSYHEVSERLSNESNNKTIELLNVQYNTEQREQKIRSLHQQATIQALELKERNLLLIITLTAAVAGGIVIFLFYRQRRFREAARLEQEIHKQRQLAARAVIEAEDQERHRIAGELHDGVGQILSGALMNLHILFEKAQLEGPERALAEKTLSLVSEGYDELRAVSHQMVPDCLIRRGLIPAIEDLLDKIGQGRLAVHFETSDMHAPCPREMETAIFRIVQEAITNVLKHASASRFSIQLFREEEGIFLSMEDDGKGFDTSIAYEGMGLRNLRNRVAYLNGTLEMESRIDKGSFLTIFLPLQAAVAEPAPEGELVPGC